MHVYCIDFSWTIQFVVLALSSTQEFLSYTSLQIDQVHVTSPGHRLFAWQNKSFKSRSPLYFHFTWHQYGLPQQIIHSTESLSFSYTKKLRADKIWEMSDMVCFTFHLSECYLKTQTSKYKKLKFFLFYVCAWNFVSHMRRRNIQLMRTAWWAAS